MVGTLARDQNGLYEFFAYATHILKWLYKPTSSISRARGHATSIVADARTSHSTLTTYLTILNGGGYESC
jgi:hypothetical protein